MFDDAPTPQGALSLQLAFRVAPGEVDQCAEALRAQDVSVESEPTGPGVTARCSSATPTAMCWRFTPTFRARGGGWLRLHRLVLSAS
jgi:hypothetical protein